MTPPIVYLAIVLLCARWGEGVTVSPETEEPQSTTLVGNGKEDNGNVTDMAFGSEKTVFTDWSSGDGNGTTMIFLDNTTVSSETGVSQSVPTSVTKHTVTDTSSGEIDGNRVNVSDIPTAWNNDTRNDNMTMTRVDVFDNGPAETSKSARPNRYAIINQGLVSKAQYETCSLIINVILKPIICVGGVIMNVIGVCVLLKKRFRRSTYTYLCLLAFADIFVLLCGIIRTIPKVAVFYDDIVANYIDMHIFPYENIFFLASLTRISEFIICALAIERFVAVLRPMKVKELFLCRHSLAVCIGISVFCFLFHMHFLFVYYPKPYFDSFGNTTMYTLGRRSWYFTSGIKPVYDMVYEFIFIYAPVVVLVSCNIGILVCLRQMSSDRRDLINNKGVDKKMSNEQRKITIILFIISLTFLIVFTPLVVLTIIQKFNKDIRLYGREHYLVYVMIDVLSLGWNISSANDFIVYIYTSKQFKAAVVDLLCTCKLRKTKTSKPTGQSLNVIRAPTSSADGTLNSQKTAETAGSVSAEASQASEVAPQTQM